MTTVSRYLGASIRMLVVLTVVLGLAYPLAVWGIGQVAFRDGANGSLLERDGTVVGSSLIGQSFEGPEWFQARPSASGYDAMASGASNLAPTSDKLLAQVERRKAALFEDDGVGVGALPPDALTASGSGLDPHISPEYAQLQVDRVAQSRGLDRSAVANLVDEYTTGRTLGFLGEPRVNVVELNLALEQLGD
jgi:K+-transporting ATPase ATPase C chain